MAPVPPLAGTFAPRVADFFVLFRFVFLVVLVVVLVLAAAPAAPTGDDVAVVRGIWMWVSSLSLSFPARSLRRRLAGGGEEEDGIAIATRMEQS